MKHPKIAFAIGLWLVTLWTGTAWAVSNITNTVSGVVTNGGGDFYFPNSSGGNTNNLLQIIAGGVLTNGTSNLSFASVGFGATDLNNTILVSGNGSAWTNAGLFHIGSSGVGSGLIVSNFGAVFGRGSSSVIGSTAGSSNNYVIVTDHAVFVCAQNPGNAALRVGDSGSSNRLVVTAAGSVLANTLTIGNAASAANNSVLVQGLASTLFITNGDINVGSSGPFCRMDVLDGAVVSNSAILRVGGATTATNNTLHVSGPGSILQIGSTLSLALSANNQVAISNGGMVSAVSVTVNAAAGSNRIIVTGGGILEGRGGNWSVSGAGNIVSNNGGVYQFTVVPAPGGVSAGGVISLTDGTMSFRNMANADVFTTLSGPLANIAYAGKNTFRLNNSSNTTAVAQNYIFDSGRGATNYVGLELVNGTTLWRSQRLTIGTNGSFLASNTIGTVAAVVTNFGTIEVKNSILTWSSNVVLNGKYTSDPSTNAFLGDVTVAPGGALAGGTGDRFEFNKNLFIQSTNNSGFNLASSSVAFTGGGMHANAITGQDLGNDGTVGYPDGFTAQNFSYGKLTIASTNDRIQFVMGDGGLSNALYVTSLDLGGFVGQFSSVSNMVTSLLFAPSSINVYYLASGPDDGYLNNLTYRLASSPGGSAGGFLMPAIPEPSALALIVSGLAFLCQRRRH